MRDTRANANHRAADANGSRRHRDAPGNGDDAAKRNLARRAFADAGIDLNADALAFINAQSGADRFAHAIGDADNAGRVR